jgi:uncharacterized protein YbjQ (UPF0145 family)
VVISTMHYLPGYEIEEVVGEVFGLTVRSRNLGSQIGELGSTWTEICAYRTAVRARKL